MSYRTKMLVPIIGMIILMGLATINVVNGDGDEVKLALPPSAGNLADAKLIEIKDGSGQVILSGNFIATGDEQDEIERTATLSGTDAHASGRAEIEISQARDGSTEQEMEISVERLAVGAAFNLFLDGQDVARFTTDSGGKAELEFSNKTSK